MRFVDLNSDMGEGFGPYTMGDDAAMLKIVTSANVACGFHAGDPIIMDRTVSMALANRVDVGAHPGFADLWGFGRRVIVGDSPKTIEKFVAYQLGALQAIAIAAGHKVTHFKAHGALGNLMFTNTEISEAVANAVASVDKDLIFVIPPRTEGERVAERRGLRIAREIFADRAYTPEGHLVSRKLPGAVIHDKDECATRVVRMLEEQAVFDIEGNKFHVRIDSVCVHGDTQDAVEVAAAVRSSIEAAGLALRPLSQHDL
ncbi:5-oxoprolinase subunit PxpA [Cupriavidus basilensis]|uniref:5-oxoprolinase subunit A n=1 Tax=Cupriavidus basilensis TaxID=68895 RepID=A0ABT6AQ86_9BURK|nr:5-oxoprolinase subunit PxpA [Cupriavidus basilensis]MDF3834786.1 5-oxoprolinase subunit PxpA [Cupriavidus basilensis]